MNPSDRAEIRRITRSLSNKSRMDLSQKKQKKSQGSTKTLNEKDRFSNGNLLVAAFKPPRQVLS